MNIKKEGGKNVPYHCQFCGCEFEEDISFIKGSGKENALCPNCGKECFVDRETIWLSFEEWKTIKKSIWDFCERVLSGRGSPGEVEILPQVLEKYVDCFRG